MIEVSEIEDLYQMKLDIEPFKVTKKADKLIDSDKFIVMPAVKLAAGELMYKFSGYVDKLNKPFNGILDKRYGNTYYTRMDVGWYAILKHPERNRFAFKTRDEQCKELKKHEEWGTLPYALHAIFTMKLLRDEDILTDYVHTSDRVHQTDGDWTMMVKNMTHVGDRERGNVLISYNSAHHGHRNTVLFVMVKL